MSSPNPTEVAPWDQGLEMVLAGRRELELELGEQSAQLVSLECHL